MKKTALFLVFLCAGIIANAQFKVGVTAGLNFANVNQNFEDPNEEFNTQFRLAPRVGVIANYALSDMISIRSGLAYSSKGYKQNESGSEEAFGVTYTYESKETFNVSYLEVPINLAIKTGNFEFLAGPYVAFGIGGTYEFSHNESASDGSSFNIEGDYDIGFSQEVTAEQDDEDKIWINGTDIGMRVGVGYDVGFGLIQVSYSKGFSNMTAGYEGSDFDPGTAKVSNSVLGVSFAYMFGE